MRYFNKSFQKGYIFIAFAFMLPLLILLGSLVLELGRGFTYKSRLQNVADAAALAAVGQLEGQNVFHLVSDCPQDAEEEENENTIKAVDNAAIKSMQTNGLNLSDDVTIVKELKKDESGYYYCVKIRDHVPLMLARTFLPESFMPEGLPISVLAWAKAESISDIDNGQAYYQLYNIGWNQTPKLMADIRASAGNDRAERIGDKDGIHYNIDEYGNVSRTETVDTREVGSQKDKRLGTYKYLFVDFQPDIQMNTTNGILKDGVRYFPFENLDSTADLSEGDWKNLRYSSILNDTASGRTSYSRTDLIKRLMSTYGIIQEIAIQILDTRIENIVLFNDLHKVRGKTREDLEKWEADKIAKNDGLVQKELKIADATQNAALGQLVVRNSKGKIAETDPLLVRIESEDIRRIHSYSSTSLFYTSSVRSLTLKIEVDNTKPEGEYRPLVIYYYGPQDSDENVGGGRESQPVTLELNANFKGILFAPYSPIIVKGNGHRIQGLVIGKSFIYNGSTITSPASSIYTDFNCSSIQFDDFDLLDIPERFRDDNHVFMTSEQAKRIK